MAADILLKGTVAVAATVNKPTDNLLMDSPTPTVEDNSINKQAGMLLRKQRMVRRRLQFLLLPNGILRRHPTGKPTTTINEQGRRLGKSLLACRKKMTTRSG